MSKTARRNAITSTPTSVIEFNASIDHPLMRPGMAEVASPHILNTALAGFISIPHPASVGFGSALNLNIHFHMLWLDGVYVEATELPRRELRLHRARAPTTA
ncbi:transposase, partial [Klebsiella pneumoniae]|nr:transposase [Klebsiella pneumoniae]